MPAKKQITRERILLAALELLKDGGIEAVNVKALARKLNCSTQPVYLSFDSMDGLRSELLSLAVDEFLNKIGYGFGKAHLYGMAYIQFAKDESKLFQYLFMRQKAYGELKDLLLPMMNTAIEKLMEDYNIDWDEAHYFHDQLWMHTHGIASMIATGFCDWNMEKVEKMLEECEKYLGEKYEGRNIFK